MLTIGLTGGYATGKSSVARILRDLGAVVVDADELSRAVIRRGEPGWREVIEVFGRGILDAGGEVDRATLGRLVFGRPALRKKLERIIHPKVIAAMRQARQKALSEGADVFVGEIPLLFEAGLEREFDLIWVVSADPGRQRERALARDGLSPEEFERRQNAQMPLEQKERRADLVLRNDGDRSELERRVLAAWGKLPIDTSHS